MHNKYYVYTHTRIDTGTIFYVGKGHGKRAWSRHSRNDWWNRVYAKTEYVVSIVQDSMIEDNAFLLEMWLIAKLRHNGVHLCNITDGGDGVRMDMISLRKPVINNDGIRFGSVNEASDWAGVSSSKITMAANGKRHSSAGYSWWYEGEESKTYIEPRDRMAGTGTVGIFCSNGMYFNSIKSASNYCKGSSGNIIQCANGKTLTAYGYAWSYLEVPDMVSNRYDRSAVSIGIPVICIENGNEYPSAEHAARFIQMLGRKSATGWPISCCAKGKSKSAYGYTWRYA